MLTFLALRRPALRVLAASAVLATSVVVATAPAQAAPPFIVDDAVDAVDTTPGDGLCATATATCTLRAAVQEANALGGVVDVLFAAAADTSTLSLAGAGGAEVGDLDIQSGVTVRLVGNMVAPNQTTLVKADPIGDRHVHVLAGGRLELVNVGLFGGKPSGDGGAILNEGQVTIANAPTSEGQYVALGSNTAGGRGGAVANRAGAQLTITNTSTSLAGSRVDVFGNSAATGGGAIANDGGTVTMSGSSSAAAHDVYVDSNSTPLEGGAVSNQGGATFTLGCRAFLRFSTADRGGDLFNDGQVSLITGGLDGGSATDGGGLYNEKSGSVSVQGDPACGSSAQVTRSVATDQGGGILNRGTITVAADAQLSVGNDGSGDDAMTGGGILMDGGAITVDGQLWVDNNASTLDGGGVAVTGGTLSTGPDGEIQVRKNRSGRDGGGIAVSAGLVTGRLLVEANAAAGVGGGLAAVGGPANFGLVDSAVVANVAAEGGGVGVVAGTVVMLNSTVAGNTATSGGGGGLSKQDGAIELRHVTVADNTPDGISSSGPLPVLQRVLMARNAGTACSTAVQAGDFNVFDDASCVPTGTDLTDGSAFPSVAALLDGNISDGAPYSYGLQPGHPAIDRVTDAGCGTPNRDQEGNPRPVDGDGLSGAQCDAGAVEAPYGGVPRSLSGTVRDENTLLPMAGVCVYAGLIGSSADGSMALTDANGEYTHVVPEGEFIIAFFLPTGGATSPKECGGAGIDKSYQPEWFRNVAVQFKPAPDDDEPIFPNLSDITTVVVAGGNVTGIDACLGAGPGAGKDAPCAPKAESGAGADATTTTTTPAATTTTGVPSGAAAGTSGSGGSGSTSSGSSSPSRLALTGSDLRLLVAAALWAMVAGVVLSRRRHRLAGV